MDDQLPKMRYRSDFERVGFRRSDIIPFLRELGIDIAAAAASSESPTAADKSDAAVQHTLPDWRELVVHWRTLTVEECADVMIGVNPAAERSYSFYDQNEDFHTWRRTIENACSSGALPAEKQADRWCVEPTALITWCQRHGYVCALKKPSDASAAAIAALGQASKANDPALQCLNPDHPRYPPRLAAAIRFWEAMEQVESKSFGKESRRWIAEHASSFKLKTSDKLAGCIAYLAMSLKDADEG